MKKIIYITIGFISLAIGITGIILPILPTVPFLLLSACMFAKGSTRIHDWFIATNIYENNLKSYVEKKGMTKITKIKVMASVTLIMTIGFVMMNNLPIAQFIMAIVWILHIIYFVFKVKTISITN